MKAVIYGNLTVDKNIINGKSYSGPGGSAFFIAKTLENLNANPIIISPYGNDFPKELLSKTLFIPENPDKIKTLVFKNIYSNKERKQSVENMQNSRLAPISEKLIKVFKKSDLIFIAPILDNIEVDSVKQISKIAANSLKVLLPQGFFRKIVRGKIKNIKCAKPQQIAKLVDIIVVSENDCPDIEKLASNLAKKGPLIIITRAERGATIYQKGFFMDYPAFRQEVIRDETGAGDIFAAAFAFNYLKSKNIAKAGLFANAAASLSLPFYPHELKYAESDIEKVLKIGKKI